ncbi:MAG: hypothetical protein HC890_14550 [Chloroflexaceae bacterium]|nr:hypothetical protein [Chloroflexaceae bacterium]
MVTAELPESSNTITDLDLDSDVIGIGGFVQGDLSFSSNADGDAVLSVAGASVAVFTGISASELETANFVFG